MEIFQVFLSHNSQDKPAVRSLATALKGRGLTVWLDEEQLVPGRPYQEGLEEIIAATESAAVLVGKDGLGPWEEPEMRACLDQFVKRRLPVIPVLLPGSGNEPKFPLFLRAFTWVDLREGLNEKGLDRLEWGITGFKPSGSTETADMVNLPPVTTESDGGPLATWRRKLKFLQAEEAKLASPALRFEVQEQIREAKQKIEELEKDLIVIEFNAPLESVREGNSFGVFREEVDKRSRMWQWVEEFDAHIELADGATVRALRLKYDVATQGTFNGWWLALEEADWSAYAKGKIVLRLHSETSGTRIFKLELKNDPDNERRVLPFIVELSTEHKAAVKRQGFCDVSIPMTEIRKDKDISRMAQLVIVFDNKVIDQKKGDLLIHSIKLSNN